MCISKNIEECNSKFKIGNSTFTHAKVKSHNIYYFLTDYDLFQGYENVFLDFLEYRARLKGKSNLDISFFRPEIIREISLIDFFKFSVKKDFMLEDWLEEKDYEIVEDHIYYKKMDLINMGQIEFEQYLINFCGSYLFIECLISSKKYVYYGD